jgi:hypothetical protein
LRSSQDENIKTCGGFTKVIMFGNSGLDHVNPPALLNIVLSGKVRLVNDARLDQKPIRLFTIKGVPPMKLVKFLKKFEKT